MSLHEESELSTGSGNSSMRNLSMRAQMKARRAGDAILYKHKVLLFASNITLRS